ncbi:MAG: hypothetical protein P8L66_08215 [Rhodospirillaceae bacterium]|nr:hypothetical protein [Rhodospirillaceae bacterium]
MSKTSEGKLRWTRARDNNGRAVLPGNPDFAGSANAALNLTYPQELLLRVKNLLSRRATKAERL